MHAQEGPAPEIPAAIVASLLALLEQKYKYWRKRHTCREIHWIAPSTLGCVCVCVCVCTINEAVDSKFRLERWREEEDMHAHVE